MSRLEMNINKNNNKKEYFIIIRKVIVNKVEKKYKKIEYSKYHLKKNEC